MFSSAYPVIRTKLLAPPPPARTLARPRLNARLLAALDYPLTLVQAGPGYGKSTALAALADRHAPFAWYHLEREDGDPYRFLLHLTHALAGALPEFSQSPLALLEQLLRQPPGQTARAEGWPPVVDLLVNALAERPLPLLLVLDDAHVLNDAPQTLALLARLIELAPPTLHLLLSTRSPIHLPNLVQLRIYGRLLTIDQSELAFTPAEVAELLAAYHAIRLTPAQAQHLSAVIEGWPIVLPLVARRLQEGWTVDQALAQLIGGTGDLFIFLTQEVLARQPAPVRDFLRQTAVLRMLSAELCDALRGSDDSAAILAHLVDNGLFVTRLDAGQWRYHHLFRDLLRNQMLADERHAAHRRAADACRQLGEPEEAVGHYLAAQAPDAAAELLTTIGQELIAGGRLDRMAEWLTRFPPETLTRYPALLLFLGDMARLRSRFEEALGWYQQAETLYRAGRDRAGQGRALRGQARVYLDTVNPSRAEQLLQDALRLSDGQEDRESRVRLLDLMAENLLNQGRLQQAEAFRSQAHALREEGPTTAELSIRMMLRTGRLAEAQAALAALLHSERQEPVLRPRSHRETLLLQAIVAAMQGDRATAARCALEGTERGRLLASPFISAVGLSRQGEAWLLHKDETGYATAQALFEQAIDLADSLEVPRLKVEAHWGLVQAHGFRGALAAALAAAEHGLAIAEDCGDEWIAACIRSALGASYVLAGQYEPALGWLAAAGDSFRACSDVHGVAVVDLWQALIWHAREDDARLNRDLTELLQLVDAHSYAFLFLRPTLMGPPDPRVLVPLLLFAAQHSPAAAVARALLQQLGLEALEQHPGYQLRVQTLGPFRLWRGREEVAAREWRRAKARQLFLLLLTQRHTLLHREQIVEMLWPELSPDDAQRDFKIAYNALCNVLEPARRRNAPSAYIDRDGSRYGLRETADIWIDAAAFDRLLNDADRPVQREPEAARRHYEQGLALYGGDYLSDYPYEVWCEAERRRLLQRYLRAGERFGRLLLESGDYDAAIELAQAMLARDSGWEPAYQIQMIAYGKLGNRAAVLRVYQRCEQLLARELDVAPSPATRELLATLTGVAAERS